MKKLRYGIVGFGNQGSLYARLLHGIAPARGSQYLPNNAIVGAICDIDAEKRAKALELYPEVAVFEDYKEMIDSGLVDAVVTTLPHYFHPEVAIYALEHGVHALVEKPASVASKHVREMNECAARHPELAFGIMFNQRTNPLYIRVRDLIKSGELGEIRRSNWIVNSWYRTDSYYRTSEWRATWGGEGGGVLVNQAPHQLDLWQWICGVPTAVTAKCIDGAHRDVVVETDATIMTEYANGATGVFVTCTHDMKGTNRFEIDLSKGKIVIEDNRATILHFAADEADVNGKMNPREAMMLTMGNAAGGGQQNEVEIVEGVPGEGPQQGGVLENFAAHILDGTPLLAPGADGINGVNLANAAQLSSWLGGVKMTTPVDEELYLSELNKRIAAEGKFPTR